MAKLAVRVTYTSQLKPGRQRHQCLTPSGSTPSAGRNAWRICWVFGAQNTISAQMMVQLICGPPLKVNVFSKRTPCCASHPPAAPSLSSQR